MRGVRVGLILLILMFLLAYNLFAQSGKLPECMQAPGDSRFNCLTGLYGFSLRGKLEFRGYSNGTPIYGIGSQALSISSGDPSLQNRLKELEGQQVVIAIQLDR